MAPSLYRPCSFCVPGDEVTLLRRLELLMVHQAMRHDLDDISDGLTLYKQNFECQRSLPRVVAKKNPRAPPLDVKRGLASWQCVNNVARAFMAAHDQRQS